MPKTRGRKDGGAVRSLVQASEHHLADCRFRNLSPKTIELYGGYEEAFIEWCVATGKGITLSNLNAANVRDHSGHIRDRHGGKRGGEWAARACVSTLKVWSRHLVEEDVLEADYLAKLRLPRVTTVARQAYEMWEIQALRGAMAENSTATRDIAMLSMLIDTGMRVGELVKLRLQDVDLQARKLKVYGKGRLERLVSFGSSDHRDGGATPRRLREYLRVRHVRATVSGEAQTRLWMSYDGMPLTDVGVRAVFAKAARRAGLSHQEVHATRHTYSVRYLVKHPGDVEGLRYNLGHLSSDMYRSYIGQASQIIADIAGRDSVADAMFGEEAPSQPRLRALPSNSPSRAGRNGPAAPPLSRDADRTARQPARSQRRPV